MEFTKRELEMLIDGLKCLICDYTFSDEDEQEYENLKLKLEKERANEQN